MKLTEPSIERSRHMKLVGLHARMSFGEPAMSELWQAFGPRARQIGNRSSQDFVSMRVFVPPLTTMPRLDSPFVQWAAVEVHDFDHVPEGLETCVVPAGLYAVLVHHGTAESFGRTVEFIFRDWLPQSPYQLASREFFEILGPDYRPDDPDASEEVWIPIEPRDRGGVAEEDPATRPLGPILT